MVLIVVPFLMLAAFIVTFAWVAGETQSATAATRKLNEASRADAALLTMLVDAETGMRGYLSTGDPEFKEPFLRTAASLPVQLAVVSRPLPEAAAFANRRAEMVSLAQRAFDVDRRLVGLADAGARIDAIRGLGSGKRAMDAFRLSYSGVSARMVSAVAVTAEGLGDAWRRTYILLAVDGLAGSATMLALYVMVSRRIVRRLNKVREDAVAIAQGVLPSEPASECDEIALLDATLRTMLQDLKTRDQMLARYKLFAEHGREIVVFVDARSNVIEANACALEEYGYSREEMLSLPLSALHCTPPQRVEALLERVRADGVLVEEAMQIRKNGEQFPVETSYAAAQVDGEVLVLAVGRDITERRRTEEALAQAYDRAVESSRLKSQFVATMSHEIRTPMNAVIGMNELLLGTQLTDEQRDYAQTVRDSSFALLRVIDDVLDFSKIEAGKMRIESLDLDLPDAVESAAALFAPAASAKGLSLMTFVDPKMPPVVRGDQNRLRQVLINLIGNAVKFTDTGGVIVSAVPKKQDETGICVRFCVKDTGIGFDAATSEAIFEPFRQADGSTTRKYGGTGLGLSISRQLVELMGGTFEVSSEPGVGSEFSFSVQFERAKKDAAEPALPLAGARVLLVDDNAFARDILHNYLTGWGVEAALADSVSTALQLLHSAAAAQAPYDCVVVDYAMPEATGFDLGANVKADPLLAPTPLIMITAYDGSRRGEEAIAAGFSSYLTKPIRRAQLRDCLESAMRDARDDSRARARAKAAAPIRPMRLDDARRRAERILIAEDAPINQRLAVQQLKKLGFSAEVVADGREALQALSNATFDLVLMDCQMPSMDGMMATRAIREDELRTGRHLPIVAMTANARPEDREACLASGMDDYLAKPVQLDQIRAVLDKWIPAGAARA